MAFLLFCLSSHSLSILSLFNSIASFLFLSKSSSTACILTATRASTLSISSALSQVSLFKFSLIPLFVFPSLLFYFRFSDFFGLSLFAFALFTLLNLSSTLSSFCLSSFSVFFLSIIQTSVLSLKGCF